MMLGVANWLLLGYIILIIFFNYANVLQHFVILVIYCTYSIMNLQLSL